MMTEPPAHNLLIVSDMHVAEGLAAEAGEASYGHDAFLYDGAFARFLRYHQRLRQAAEARLQEAEERTRRGMARHRATASGLSCTFW